MPHLQQGWKPV